LGRVSISKRPYLAADVVEGGIYKKVAKPLWPNRRIIGGHCGFRRMIRILKRASPF
jgi:hypothetical protein